MNIAIAMTPGEAVTHMYLMSYSVLLYMYFILEEHLAKSYRNMRGLLGW